MATPLVLSLGPGVSAVNATIPPHRPPSTTWATALLLAALLWALWPSPGALATLSLYPTHVLVPPRHQPAPLIPSMDRVIRFTLGVTPSMVGAVPSPPKSSIHTRLGPARAPVAEQLWVYWPWQGLVLGLGVLGAVVGVVVAFGRVRQCTTPSGLAMAAATGR